MIPVKEFFTGGRATFTLEVPELFANTTGCRPHYTYRIYRKKDKKDERKKGRTTYIYRHVYTRVHVYAKGKVIMSV